MSTLEYSEQFAYVESSFDNDQDCKIRPFFTTSVFPIVNSVIRHRSPVAPFNCENSNIEFYHCKDCNFHTELKLVFKKHIEENHNSGEENESNYNIPKYGCGNCSFETYFSLKLLQHTASCVGSVENPQNLNKRIKTHNGDDQNIKYKCRKCSDNTKPCECVKNHETTCHTSKKLNINTSISLHSGNKNHINAHHLLDQQNIEWYKCEQCPYKSKQTCNLKVHITVHHSPKEDIKWYKCQNCAFRTKYSAGLKYHIISRHLDEQDIEWYKCDKCSYKCIQRYTLKRHLNTRHLGKTYTCQICPDNSKTFQSNNLLKRHMKRCHFNGAYIKWFECQKCPFKSRRLAALKSHIHYWHTRHSVKQDEDFTWFYCEKCPYKAKFKYVLERHHRFWHKGDKIKRHECENPYIVENSSDTKGLINAFQTGANINIVNLRRKLNMKIISTNVSE